MAKKPKPLIVPRPPPRPVRPEVLEDFIRGKDLADSGVLTDALEHPSTLAKTSASTAGAFSESPPAPSTMPASTPVAAPTSVDGSSRSDASNAISENSQITARQRGLVAREGGRLRRRRTIYLPPELDERLETWCADQGREVSHAIAEAIRRMLGSV